MAKTKTKSKSNDNGRTPMNFRAPTKLCNDFKLACAKMGVSYSTVFTACMIATLRNKKIPFEIGFDDDFTTSDIKYITIDSNIDTDENIMSDTDSTNNAINNTSNDSENTISDSNSNKDNSKDFKFFDDMWVENKDK